MVTVAPASVVKTVGLLNMTPFVAARSIAAPATEALPLVNAKMVKVSKDVPSAFKTLALALILIDATLALTTRGGKIGVVGVLGASGVLAFPPPPPQAAKHVTNATTIPYFKKFMLMFPRFFFNK